MTNLIITVRVVLPEAVANIFGFNYDSILKVKTGDWAYYTPTQTVTGIDGSVSSNDVITVLGRIKDIEAGPEVTGYSNSGVPNQWNAGAMDVILTCDAPNGTVPPSQDDFVFFAKDPNAEINTIVGYYNKSRFSNDSTDKAELFSASCEYFESSK